MALSNERSPLPQCNAITKLPMYAKPPSIARENNRKTPLNSPRLGSICSSVLQLRHEIEQKLHVMFVMLEETGKDTKLGHIDKEKRLISGCHRAFQFYTRTNTITTEAFYHRTCKLGICASQSVCNELFRTLDSRGLGEIDFNAFARYFFSLLEEHPTQCDRESIIAKAESMAPNNKNNIQINESRLTHLFESISIIELQNLLARKLEARAPRPADCYRQSFRFFTQSNTITYSDFEKRLKFLQIYVSPYKCRELFNRLDVHGNGEIEMNDFTSTLFSKKEYETAKEELPFSNILVRPEYVTPLSVTLSLTDVLAQLRDKLDQHLSKETDRYRQAIKLLRKSSHISRSDLSRGLRCLGLNLPKPLLDSVFDYFDTDQSGVLDVAKILRGVTPPSLQPQDDSSYSNVSDRDAVEQTRKTRNCMALQLLQRSWTMDQIEHMLREKIEQRTSKSSDCFRQAFRIFKKVNGIKRTEFHTSLQACGLSLTREQSDELFTRYDLDGSGDLDLNEFIHGVLAPDYTGHQWVSEADSLRAAEIEKKKLESLLRPDRYMTDAEMESWSLDEIEIRIRDKIEQATRKSSDTFRQAYKIFQKTQNITLKQFRERVLALGFRLTDAQCEGLFNRYDLNQSNDLDLQEFCMAIKPPDYSGEGDYWSHTQQFKNHRRRQQIDYVKRSKNGLLLLPQFKQTYKYVQGSSENSTPNQEVGPEINRAPSPPVIQSLISDKSADTQTVISPRMLKSITCIKPSSAGNDSALGHCTPRRPITCSSSASTSANPQEHDQATEQNVKNRNIRIHIRREPKIHFQMGKIPDVRTAQHVEPLLSARFTPRSNIAVFRKRIVQAQTSRTK